MTQQDPARDPSSARSPEERLEQVRQQAADFMAKRKATRSAESEGAALSKEAQGEGQRLSAEANRPPATGESERPPAQATAEDQKQEAAETTPPQSATEAHESALSALRRFGFGEDVTKSWSLDQILEKGARLQKMQTDFDTLKGDVKVLREGTAGTAGSSADQTTEVSDLLDEAGVEEGSTVALALGKILEERFRDYEGRLEQALSRVDQAVVSTAQRELDSKRSELARFYPDLARDDGKWTAVQQRAKRLLATGGYQTQNELMRDACMLELGAPRDVSEEAARDGARPTVPGSRSSQPLTHQEKVLIAARHLRANPGDTTGARRAAGF